MIVEEAYVSFETAKLLKEKRFSGACRTFYTIEGMLVHLNNLVVGKYGFGINGQTGFLAPTQQMAIGLLRENCNLLLSCETDVNGWTCTVSKVHRDSDGRIISVEDYDDALPCCNTYEDACDAAIKYCLERLILKD